ncbi:hypothetical protein GJ496_006949 [Pomphorhynchus laevis]|nr:hypothetical protein GJ496_006949 [Pomphorhynchus laevis]
MMTNLMDSIATIKVDYTEPRTVNSNKGAAVSIISVELWHKIGCPKLTNVKYIHTYAGGSVQTMGSCDKVIWKWEVKHSDEFEMIKRILLNPRALVPYDGKLQVKVMADASESGLGAVLLQESSNGTYKPEMSLANKPKMSHRMEQKKPKISHLMELISQK